MVLLSTRERILAIQLLEKISKHPMYAKALGIEGVQAKVSADEWIVSDTTGSSRNA